MKWFIKIAEWWSPTLFLRDTKTVHYAFSLLFFIAAALSMAALSGGSTSYITLKSSKPFVTAGDTFEIEVRAYAHVPVNALTVGIEFPTDMIEVTGIDRGTSVITLWTEDPKVENNTVILSGGTYRKGFVGDHQIAIINVRAKQTGQASFITEKAEMLAGDGKGTTLATDTKRGMLELKIIDGDAAPVTDRAVAVIITDLTNDGEVGLDDVSAFMAAWATRRTIHDFNGDGAMTFRDFSIILAEYFRGAEG